MHKNTIKKWDRVKNRQDTRKFEPKIRTVSLKMGQLESMTMVVIMIVPAMNKNRTFQ